MQPKTLRLTILFTTFLIGVSAVSIWFFNEQTNLEIPSIDIPEKYEKTIVIEQNSLQITDEDYAVYSAILTDEQPDAELIVINDHTSHGLIANAKNFSNSISNLSEDIIQDYQIKNEDDLKLSNNFLIKNKISFLSDKEENQIFRKGQDGWANFHKKFPKANVIISFSRVGLNKERTQALVSVSTGCGWLCGEGNFILLQKESGKWIIQNKIRLWVS